MVAMILFSRRWLILWVFFFFFFQESLGVVQPEEVEHVEGGIFGRLEIQTD